MSATLSIESIHVDYPAGKSVCRVVNDLSLTLAPGEIGCLLGASGCGKTTVLRAIAGFEPLAGGRIALDALEVAGPGVDLPTESRRVGMMFQDYALFPHLSAARNVGFGLSRMTRDARAQRVHEMLDFVGLAGSGSAFPHELSGGQQQRVALARALAPAPAVLLLDEPLSGLDAVTRQRLMHDLRGLLKSSGTTVLMVTHDQDEAFAIADRIGVMSEGRIAQWADAKTLYARPSNSFVAGFIGEGEWISGATLGLSGPDQVLLRPHQLRASAQGTLRATLVAVSFRGPHYRGTVRFPSGELAAMDLQERDLVTVGESLTVEFVGGDTLFSDSTGAGVTVLK